MCCRVVLHSMAREYGSCCRHGFLKTYSASSSPRCDQVQICHTCGAEGGIKNGLSAESGINDSSDCAELNLVFTQTTHLDVGLGYRSNTGLCVLSDGSEEHFSRSI